MPLLASRSRSQSGSSSYRVLCVNDALEIAVFLGIVLRSYGHAAEYAEDGKAALERLRHLRPDLIVVNLSLPDFEAAALIRYLRSDPVTRAVPLLCIQPAGRAVGPRAANAAERIAVAAEAPWISELIAELERDAEHAPIRVVRSTAAVMRPLQDAQVAEPRMAALFASTSAPRSAVS